MQRAMLLLLSACAAGGALAQNEGRRDPANTDAPAPALTYRSVFADYIPYREQDVAPWREINDEVARIGGHAGMQKAAKAGKAGNSATSEKRAVDKPAGGHPQGGRP